MPAKAAGWAARSRWRLVQTCGGGGGPVPIISAERSRGQMARRGRAGGAEQWMPNDGCRGSARVIRARPNRVEGWSNAYGGNHFLEGLFQHLLFPSYSKYIQRGCIGPEGGPEAPSLYIRAMAQRPAKIKWTRPCPRPLAPLSDSAALQVFMDISDADHDDACVAKLLTYTGNLPLAPADEQRTHVERAILLPQLQTSMARTQRHDGHRWKTPGSRRRHRTCWQRVVEPPRNHPREKGPAGKRERREVIPSEISRFTLSAESIESERG
ncbi:hypothetical protein FB451DRAFT_1495559 [Mycena latifolia]|nr:hypothetical protein FB451DRAFT_1495559 [Mycena latifolia]